ncbi:type II toxin-antitoxin system RelE/ParE family toxin [Methylocystis echinoides]|jgi:toxin ParE1/3/4|uniref:type II toxin-antitoxin system RelE/ParE family toxin n=1 Tax=Methylocystis echinoides TaxID=29468 RepID=UPI002491B847|nr:type II toxin-antitoxin system RelE/ParE family toxin [Methylocystis echinoides]
MRQLTLSARAQADIEELWDYTVERWSVDRAEVYLRKIKAAVEAVADEPRLGRPCDEVRAGYRKYAAASHVLFYARRRRYCAHSASAHGLRTSSMRIVVNKNSRCGVLATPHCS